MLTIYPPEIIEHENETVLQAKFECGEIRDTLWFSTTKEFGKYLCHERGDAFLVALLLYAMERGENITVISPVSERLYYTLTKHLVKVISDISPGYRPIKITATVDAGMLENAGAVGTGFSGGIDSFCTLVEHTRESCPPGYKLTHLTFFNVGASGDYGGYHARELFHRRIEAVRPCAEELKLPIVILDSNISEILGMNFELSLTYRNAAAVLALQKLFRVYYFSSGHSVHDFELDYLDAGRYDPYSLDMLSTEGTKFFSSGENYTRVEKTEIVSGFPLSYPYLNVCIAAETNCGRCHKCQRTLVTLDVLGKLDLYKTAFNLDDYRLHRSKYFGMILSGWKKDLFKKEIYDRMRRDNFKIPLGAFLYRYPLVIFPEGVRQYPDLIKRKVRQLKNNKI